MTDAVTPVLAAERALEWIEPGMVIGLGTGRAAVAFIEALARSHRERGLKVLTVSSSLATAALARRLGLPEADLRDLENLDLTVDGADEVDPDRNLIKGLGGALLREKVLASISRRWLICVGAEKCVTRLGARGVLPVEVVPFAESVCVRALDRLGLPAQVRQSGGARFVTDNGNHVLDCRIAPTLDHARLAAAIRAIPGVVETGYFLDMSPTVLVQHNHQVEVLGG
ncbi:MAG: ribose-5-phosphate isomerase A [Isosphaeraceae bacterium]|nr:MAG: ribose-5-phosphate isomerase A [Isosphaeraceae bacterium]